LKGIINDCISHQGYRFYGEEVVARLKLHPDVIDCQVLSVEDELFAVIQASEGDAKESDWVRELDQFSRSELASYMQPSGYVLGVPEPAITDTANDARILWVTQLPQLQPQTDIEVRLACIWQELLEADNIRLHDNFFALGGGSLTCVRLEFAIQNEFQIQVSTTELFEYPDLESQARLIENKSGGVHLPAITSLPRNQTQYSLSFAQQRLWFIDQLEGQSPQYNMPLALRIDGILDRQALVDALNQVVQRHEVLRTLYLSDPQGQPYQQIEQGRRLEIPLIDLTLLPEAEQQQELQLHYDLCAQQPFNLLKDLMVRGCLVQLSSDSHVLMLTLHHIASDGWSMAVLMDEASWFYNNKVNGTDKLLPSLAIQYLDFALWQRQWLTGEQLQSQLDYWKKALDGAPEVHSLPLDRPRKDIQSTKGGIYSHRFPSSLLTALRQLAQSHQATLFVTLQTAFAVLMSRYSGESDILMGTPVANRNNIETTGLIGFFVNTLVLRTEVSASKTFTQLLSANKKTVLNALGHQTVPFDVVVETLQPKRSLSYNPLFQIMFSVESNEGGKLSLVGLQHEFLQLGHKTAQFDISLSLHESESEFSASWEFAQDLFDEASIQRMAESFEVMLHAITVDPEDEVAHLPLFDLTRHTACLQHWNSTESSYQKDSCITDYFYEWVNRTPDKIAVTDRGRSLSYRELDFKSNQMAHLLISQGVEPGDFVGLCIERSVDMILAILAVIKAGAAYVPLDPAYPSERLAYIVADSQIKCVLGRQRHLEQNGLQIENLICLDTSATKEKIAKQAGHIPGIRVDAQQLVYMIYTSGSTGQPKGVQISHQNLVSYLQVIKHDFAVTTQDRVLQFASYSFDLFFEEFSNALLMGGTLVLRNDEMVAGGDAFWTFIIEQQITVASITTALWHQLCADSYSLHRALTSSLRLFIIGGEAMSARAIIQWQEIVKNRIRVLNVYGPTEATISATCFDISDFDAECTDVPIGQAVRNTELYVLDERQQLLPAGIVGELYIAGDRLATSYHMRPELTAQRFVTLTLPGIGSRRLYRSGDLVRRQASGQLTFVGRIDEQVKIRGFRVELGEIASALHHHDSVDDALVLCLETAQQDKRLVAYVVSDTKEKDRLPALLFTALKSKLPQHMIPSAFVVLDAFPLNAIGKIDRKALPVPNFHSLEQRVYVAPVSAIEESLCVVWQSLLDLDSVGTEDNFFDIGGHSLLVARLISEIRQQFDVELSVKTLFANQTVKEQALLIEEEQMLSRGLVVREILVEGVQEEKWEF
jgi:amino acid adenylation domain-containing protein